MSGRRLWRLGLTAAAAATSATVLAATGSWGIAIEVPGSAHLNARLNARVTSISCPKAGFCAAGGSYADRFGRSQAFVVDERHGVWRKAHEVPGTGALNVGGNARVTSLSCAKPGFCAAGGYYNAAPHGRSGGLFFQRAFVANESGGVWHRAIAVPRSATVGLRHYAAVEAVSCPAAGFCAAGGTYADEARVRPRRHLSHAFVVDETNGMWGAARMVPSVSSHQAADVSAISCPRVGFCAVGGSYNPVGHRFPYEHEQTFVLDEAYGRWSATTHVAVGASLNRGASAELKEISCAAVGYCAAGGFYAPGRKAFAAPFVTDEKAGVWHAAIKVPGSAALNGGGFWNNDVGVMSLSCAAAGWCAAGGFYQTAQSVLQPWVVNERDGLWRKAIKVRGALVLGGDAFVTSISCATATSCTAGGVYTYSNAGNTDHFQGFLVSETNGVWGKAVLVPGLAALNHNDDSRVTSVSCAAGARVCGVGGYYTVTTRVGATGYQGFVTAP